MGKIACSAGRVGLAALALGVLSCTLTDDLSDLTENFGAAGFVSTSGSGAGGSLPTAGAGGGGQGGGVGGQGPVAGAGGASGGAGAGGTAAGAGGSAAGAGGSAQSDAGGGLGGSGGGGAGGGAVRVYWSERTGREVRVAFTDGRSPQQILSIMGGGSSQPAYLVVAETLQPKLFFSDMGRNRLQSANLDGNALTQVVPTVQGPRGVDVDVDAQKLYFADQGTNVGVYRSNFDGSSLEPLVTTGLSEPVGIALSLVEDALFIADAGANAIFRASSDGAGLVDLEIPDVAAPVDIAVDERGGRIYWTEQGATAKVRRALLDGSSPEDIVTPATLAGFAEPFGIAVDGALEQLYFVRSGAGGAIYKSDLLGQGAVELLGPLADPAGVALTTQ